MNKNHFYHSDLKIVFKEKGLQQQQPRFQLNLLIECVKDWSDQNCSQIWFLQSWQIILPGPSGLCPARPEYLFHISQINFPWGESANSPVNSSLERNRKYSIYRVSWNNIPFPIINLFLKVFTSGSTVDNCNLFYRNYAL